MDDVAKMLEPGALVRNPVAPEWGLGQVQSVIGGRVTVMFENAGKICMETRHSPLDMVVDT